MDEWHDICIESVNTNVYYLNLSYEVYNTFKCKVVKEQKKKNGTEWDSEM